jgi:hypothetical protein
VPSDPADEYRIRVRMEGGPFEMVKDAESVIRM